MEDTGGEAKVGVSRLPLAPGDAAHPAATTHHEGDEGPDACFLESLSRGSAAGELFEAAHSQHSSSSAAAEQSKGDDVIGRGLLSDPIVVIEEEQLSAAMHRSKSLNSHANLGPGEDLVLHIVNDPALRLEIFARNKSQGRVKSSLPKNIAQSSIEEIIKDAFTTQVEKSLT